MSSLYSGTTPTLTAVSAVQTTESITELDMSSPIIDLKTNSKICNHPECRVKLSILDKGIPCQCTHLFCSKHRFADRLHSDSSHKCPFDYKTSAKELLKKVNEGVKADKLTRI